MTFATLALTLSLAASNNATKVMPEYRAIVLVPLTSMGSTVESVQAVERVLIGELKKLVGDRLLMRPELEKRNRRLVRYLDACDGVTGCLLEVAGAYGLEAFLTGNLVGLGEDRALTLKLIDIKSGTARRSSNENASGAEAELIVKMRKAAVLVLAPELFTGFLLVQATQPGLRISVDGELVATTPLANPRLELTAGRHAVEAQGDGLVPFSQMVQLGYGEVMPLSIQLPENKLFVGGATPFYARWWPWVMTAVGLAAGVAGGYFYYDYGVRTDRLVGTGERGELTYANVSTIQRERDRSLLLSRTLGAGGGALVLCAGAFFAFDLL